MPVVIWLPLADLYVTVSGGSRDTVIVLDPYSIVDGRASFFRTDYGCVRL